MQFILYFKELYMHSPEHLSLIVKYPDGFLLTYNKIPFYWLCRRLPRRKDKCLRPSAIHVSYPSEVIPYELFVLLNRAWGALHPLKREFIKINGKHFMDNQFVWLPTLTKEDQEKTNEPNENRIGFVRKHVDTLTDTERAFVHLNKDRLYKHIVS